MSNQIVIQELMDKGFLFVGDGYRAKNSELSKAGLPFARAGNINSGFHFDGAECIPEDKLAKVGNKVSKPGDVVFTSKGTVGRFAFVDTDTQPFVYSPQLCFWRSLNPNVIRPRYLYYWMSSREFFLQFNSVKGQTDMADYVSLTDQRRMKLSVPEIKVQDAIADILGPLDDKIELNRKMNETLEQMARAIFKSWFIDFDPVHAKHQGKKPFGMDELTAALFPDSFEPSEFGEIPKGWRVGRLNEVADVVGGGTPSTANDTFFCEAGKGIPWLSPKDLSGFNYKFISHGASDITEAGLKNSSAKVLDPGAVLFSSRAPIGYIAIAENKVTTNQGFKSLIPKNGYGSDFLYYWLKFNTDAIESRASGSTFKEISGNGMKEMPVLIPSEPIAVSFARLLDQNTEYQKLLRRENIALVKVRDLLLPRLLSGDLSVKEVS